jgi:predicted transcriptional regulator
MKQQVNTQDIRTMAAEVLAANGQKQTAKYLGIAPSTLKRYMRTNRAPQATKMALFWITAAGKHELNIDLMNEVMVFRGLARALQGHNADLRNAISSQESEIQHLSSIHRARGSQGVAANEMFLYY